MPIIRTFAKQGHAIPSGPHSPRGPFPPELFRAAESAQEETIYGDSLHEALDDIRMFRCKYCHDVLYLDELDEHICEEE